MDDLSEHQIFDDIEALKRLGVPLDLEETPDAPRFDAVEVFQRITDRLVEDFTHDPEEVRRFFVSNVLRRTIAHLVGLQANGNTRRVRVDDAGRLLTIQFPEAWDDVETVAINADNGAGQTFTPANPFEYFEGWFNNEDATVQVRRLDGTLTTAFAIEQGYYERGVVGDRLVILSQSATNVTGDINTWRLR